MFSRRSRKRIWTRTASAFAVADRFHPFPKEPVMVATALPEQAQSRRRLSIRASDVTGQRVVRMNDVEGATTVGELVDRLIPGMGPPSEVDGRPLSYSARLDREGRHLNASEDVSEALREDDQLVISPNIDAG